MSNIVLIVLTLFLGYSCVPSGAKSVGDGDGTTDGATSSGGETNSTQTNTDTDTSTDGETLNLAAPANLAVAEATMFASDRSPEINWDSVNGATSYEVAIGSTSGGTEILTWTNVGNVNVYQATGLTLTPGSYYASVRAVGPNNEKGPVSTADAWTVTVKILYGYLFLKKIIICLKKIIMKLIIMMSIIVMRFTLLKTKE